MANDRTAKLCSFEEDLGHSSLSTPTLYAHNVKQMSPPPSVRKELLFLGTKILIENGNDNQE